MGEMLKSCSRSCFAGLDYSGVGIAKPPSARKEKEENPRILQCLAAQHLP